MPRKKYRSDALRSVHVTVDGLHRIGLVDKKTMRDFDDSCLTSVEHLSRRISRRSVSAPASARAYLLATSTCLRAWCRSGSAASDIPLALLSSSCRS